MNIDRRTLLIGGGAGVGLVIAFALWPHRLSSDLAAGKDDQRFGNFIRIARSGTVTVAVAQAETGQGAWTALPQIVADELGAAWEMVAVEPAPLDAAFANPLAKAQGWLDGFGTLRAHAIGGDGRMQITAEATSVRAFEAPLRAAATVARTMLVGAAADRWNVDPTECDTGDGFVINRGRTFTFGELAEEAADRTPPRNPALKQSTHARLAGQPLQRLDGPSKAKGGLRFAGDVRLPDMLFASARLAPPGGRLIGFSRSSVAGRPGVRHVAARDGWVAVAADSWWTAEQALKAADPRFSAATTVPNPRPIFEDAIANGAATVAFKRGDYAAAVRGSRPLAATYYVAPSQHLAIEPVSATARIANGTVEAWAPSQAPAFARVAAAELAGVGTSDSAFYPMPIGEPAGRSMENPALPIAIELARAMRRPVQLTLSSAASHNHDRLAPGALMRMTALPGAGGITSAWQMRIATGAGLGGALARLAGSKPSDAIGARDLGGAIPPYAFADARIDAIVAPLPFASGYMRGSPEREIAFATECFIDELAHAAGMEPLAFRMSLLGGNGRLARCLQTATRLAQWDGGRAGSTMGIAGVSAFGSHIGLVASASIGEGQSVQVHRLIAAVDCGRAINPGLVAQQVESSLIWAIGQALVAAPEWVAGMPHAQAMSAVGLPRIGETPQIFVHLVPSSDPPGGVNGLGATVLAPAVANAIFAGSGKRMRDLPFDPMATR